MSCFCSYLNTVVARCDAPALHLDVVRRVRELALVVGAGALVALVLAAHLQLQPAGVLLVQQRAHVEQRRRRGGGGRGGRGRRRRRRRGGGRRLEGGSRRRQGEVVSGGEAGEAVGREAGRCRGHVLLVGGLCGGRGGRGRGAAHVGHCGGTRS